MASGGSGAGAGGGGYSGGGLANTGGTGYGGDLGGYGTAGEKSSGAGGSAMAGYGNTGAGGSGMAGVSSMSGYTSPGFTPAYGDPRGTSIGMDPYGNYKGSPNYSGIGAPGKPSTMTPKAQMDAFGYVKTATPPPARQPAPAPAPAPARPPGGVSPPITGGGNIGFPSPIGSGPGLGQLGIGIGSPNVGRTGPATQTGSGPNSSSFGQTGQASMTGSKGQFGGGPASTGFGGGTSGGRGTYGGAR